MTTTVGLPSAVPSSAFSSAVWLSNDRLVKDVGSPRPAVIDLDRPGRGITIEMPDAVTHGLLGLDLRSAFRFADSWVRGDDVTAVYETSDTRHLRTTAMWRIRRSASTIRAWELIASTQTSVLQSDAAVAVISEIDATDALWGTWARGTVVWHDDPATEPTCMLLQASGPDGAHGTSVLVASHPCDAGQMKLRMDGGQSMVECGLFSAGVEKGVLLRSRVLAAIGPSANAREWAAGIVAEFAVSPPMLTT